MSDLSATEKLRRHFRANIGRVMESSELHKAAGGKVEFGRRIRELRQREGWKILTHVDRDDLKPGQYLLNEKPPDRSAVAFERGISAKLRAQVLDRNGFTCQMCGNTPGEVDPLTGRKVKLHIGHIKDESLGGKAELSNLRALCASCNQGAKNTTAEKPTTIKLLGDIRRAGQDEQKAVLDWLAKKFAPKK